MICMEIIPTSSVDALINGILSCAAKHDYYSQQLLKHVDPLGCNENSRVSNFVCLLKCIRKYGKSENVKKAFR